MNEIDLVVQKRQKPNSSEIETNLMEPNDAFWRFISEVQPTDLRSCCFSEGKTMYAAIDFLLFKSFKTKNEFILEIII